MVVMAASLLWWGWTAPSTLLRLLNEDLFIGGLSGTAYAADRKRVR
jgi:hypothetical protein